MPNRIRGTSSLMAVLIFVAPVASWAEPGEATNLRWCSGTKSCLEWDAASPPGSYRIVQGTTASLPGLLDSAIDSCTVATFSGTSTGSVLTDAPAAGNLYWYIVVATICAGDGSAGNGTAGARIVNSGGDCAPPSCVNGVRDGTESDTDCGGSSCEGCAPGQHCCAGTDCSALVCILDVCAGASCVDGVQNGNETDVDCGGGTCPSCPDGLRCAVGSDCSSHICSQGHCAAPSCADGVQNGNETDVDCGGGCEACANGKGCGVDSDCQSGVCYNGVCQISYCADTDGDGCEELADCCLSHCGSAGHGGSGTLNDPYSDCTGVTTCAYCTTTGGTLAFCGQSALGCRVCGLPCQP